MHGLQKSLPQIIKENPRPVQTFIRDAKESIKRGWGEIAPSVRKVASDVWNSPTSRTIIPDFVSFGVGFSGVVAVGGGTSLELNWIVRGPDASLLPALTTSQNIGIGFSTDVSFNVGGFSYLGPVSDIQRGFLQTDIREGVYPSLWMSGGFSPVGGRIGGTAEFTKLDKGALLGGQLNIGAGLPTGPVPNIAGGVGNTFILKDFYKKKR